MLHHFLVGGLEHEFYFSIQLGMSSSQLNFTFFRGIGQPPTSFTWIFHNTSILGTPHLWKAPNKTVAHFQPVGHRAPKG